MEKKLYGLLGRKLSHSFSCEIHAMLGNPDYKLIELEPEELEGFLHRGDIGGLNVTIPYKRDVIPFCTLSPEAKEIGSVNTIVSRDGKLFGYNTDETGFEYMVREAGIEICGKRVAVLGSGGASLAVQYAAKKLGAADIKVVSRTGTYNYSDISPWCDAQVIVNATPVGMYPASEALPIELSSFPQCSAVLDVIYNPLNTALLTQAQRLHIPCAGGLSMLVSQAKSAEELFFDAQVSDEKTQEIIMALRRNTANIALIGMPGCGKSSVGRELARLSGRELLDTDEMVEREAQAAIPEIFEKQGEAAFRALEHQALKKAGGLTGKIIVTGGGVVEDPANYFLLHQNSVIYRLDRPAELLETKGRPLSKSVGLSELMKRRMGLYETFADAVIDNDRTLLSAAERLWTDFLSRVF